MSRILRLITLAPDIMEAILRGPVDQALMLERLERPLPAIIGTRWREHSNPIGCMVTWGALNIVGGDTCTRERIADVQRRIAKAVDERITELAIEHHAQGNRAKAYLWCLEARCPRTDWLMPMATSWMIGRNYGVCAGIVPDHTNQRFEIEIVTDASPENLTAAASGTVQGTTDW